MNNTQLTQQISEIADTYNPDEVLCTLMSVLKNRPEYRTTRVTVLDGINDQLIEMADPELFPSAYAYMVETIGPDED